MSDLPADNYVINYMRRIEIKIDRLIDEMHDIKLRTTAIEEAMAGTHRRLDRLEARFDRIERRQDLVEGR